VLQEDVWANIEKNCTESIVKRGEEAEAKKRVDINSGECWNSRTTLKVQHRRVFWCSKFIGCESGQDDIDYVAHYMQCINW